MSSITVKIYQQHQLRKLRLQQPNWSELSQKVGHHNDDNAPGQNLISQIRHVFFNDDGAQEINLQYIDDDNDVVTLSSQQELTDVLATHAQNGSTPVLFLKYRR